MGLAHWTNGNPGKPGIREDNGWGVRVRIAVDGKIVLSVAIETCCVQIQSLEPVSGGNSDWGFHTSR